MEENKKKSDKLSEINQEYPFRVPDGYFDNFYAKLEKKLSSGKPEAVKEFWIYHYLKPALAVAASLALIFLILYWPLNSFVPKNLVKSGQNEDASIDDDYSTMVYNLDENSFYAILTEPENQVKLSEDDLVSFVNTTFSDYEIFIETINRSK